RITSIPIFSTCFSRLESTASMRTCSWHRLRSISPTSSLCAATDNLMRTGPKRMKTSFARLLFPALAMLLLFGISAAPAAPSADSLALAEQRAASALEEVTAWNGPTSGPKAVPGKVIAFIANDLRNGGISGALQGAREAIAVMGWSLNVYDAAGTEAG